MIYAVQIDSKQIDDVENNKKLISQAKIEQWHPRDKVSYETGKISH